MRVLQKLSSDRSLGKSLSLCISHRPQAAGAAEPWPTTSSSWLEKARVGGPGRNRGVLGVCSLF